ncbi:retrovirus-related pol polyprotein from transposon TNT 1-94 [Tanacetum coccineum]
MMLEKEKQVDTTPLDYAALNQLYKDFPIRFVPQTELSVELAIWSQNSVNSSEPTLSIRPTNVEVPKELPKVSMVTNRNDSVNVHECQKCLKLKTELQTDFVKRETYDKLFKSFTILEKHCISLEVDTQLKQEIFQRENFVSNQSVPSFDQLFELNELKAQSQEKDTVIKKLKERIKSLSGKIDKDKIKQDLEEIETINIELDHRVTKLIAENEHLKQTYKQLYDSIKPARIQSKEQCDGLINQVNIKKLNGKGPIDNNVSNHPSDPELHQVNVEPITPKLLNKRTAHSAYIKHSQEEAAVLRDLVDHIKANYPLDLLLESACKELKQSTSASGSQLQANKKKVKIQQTQSYLKNKVDAHPRKCNGCCFLIIHELGVLEFILMWNTLANSRSDKPTTTEVPLRKSSALDNNTPKPVVTLVYSRKPRKSTTSVPVNNYKVVQIVLWYLDSGCSKHMTGDRSQLTNFVSKFLGTVKFGNDHVAKIMGYGGLIRIGNASKTKSWLWHRRLSHLNFGAINHLARHGLVRGLPKLKFEKDHLCSACALGYRARKEPTKPKLRDTIQE